MLSVHKDPWLAFDVVDDTGWQDSFIVIIVESEASV